MKELNLNVTIDEANLILEGLGSLPFAKVYALVSKIQQQASQQLNGQEVKAAESAEAPNSPRLQETGND
jgi:hypothetical protein